MDKIAIIFKISFIQTSVKVIHSVVIKILMASSETIGTY